MENDIMLLIGIIMGVIFQLAFSLIILIALAKRQKEAQDKIKEMEERLIKYFEEEV